MATRMQQRRGTAAQWISTNNGDGPILNAGEIGFESDTGKFKIGDGVNHWVDLDYFTTGSAEDVQNQINAAIANLVDGAPTLLNTLNELAAAIGDDPQFFTTIATNLSNHESDTTNVHGIADTAELATKTFAAELLTNATKTNIAITGDKNGLTITAENGVADSDTDDLAEGTTNKYFTNQRAIDANAGLWDEAGSAQDALNSANNYTNGEISSAVLQAQTYADSLASNYDPVGSASSAVSSHNLETINVHGIANTAFLATQEYVDDAVSNAEVDQSTLAGIGIDWDGSQFNIDSTVVTLDESQTLENKTISYTNNTITVQAANVSDLTATAAELNILDGATLDVTELNYLDGVTSSVQTQLDDKLSKTGGTMTGDLTLAGLPTQALHAATKSYVDAVTEGLHIHPSCVAATTANVSIATDLEAGDVVDGVTLAEGDRVLVKAQTNAAQNGIYVVQASGAALRASDFNEPQEVDGGDFVFVTGGTLHDNTGWVQTTTNVVTIGTDPIMFTQFSGAGTYTAGTGLDLDGTIFTIDTATTVDVSTAQTLTNKTISAANNTLTIATTDLTDVTATASEINVLDGITASTAELNILDGVTATALELNVLDGITASTTELNYVDGVTSAIQTQIDGKISASSTNTLTNKTIALGSNTVSGTLAQFNTAVTDADFASLAGSETLTNKTINLTNNTLTGTLAQFNTALSNADFASLAGSETLTNKTINLSSNTLSGTTAQFNAALSDGDFATLAGTETLTNKTLSSPTITVPSETLTFTSYNNITSPYPFSNSNGEWPATLSSYNPSTGTLVVTYGNMVPDSIHYGTLSGTTVTNVSSFPLSGNASKAVAVYNSPSQYFTTLTLYLPQILGASWQSLVGTTVFATVMGSGYSFRTFGMAAGVNTISTTEIGYLDGVTSGIQTQINSKISASSSDTLTNKTIALGSNTVSGTLAQFNTAVTDADFASLAGSETLTNKTLTSPTINTALLDEPVFSSPEERWTVSATAATGTINFDAKTSGIMYYTSNASGNWTLNVRGDGSTTLNNMLATNDSITVVFFATNGSTPYYQTGFQIDGTAVTPRWQNASAPTSGNANSIDIYSFTIVKTGNAAFTVFGSQTRFA